MEYFSKTIVTRGKEISAVPPSRYCLRFQNFIKSIIEIPKTESNSNLKIILKK